MKISVTENNPKITITCCVHGDEIFGLEVFRRLSLDTERKNGLKLILVNEEAVIAKKRFLETDLNRSFPGRTDGSHEEKLALELLPHARTAQSLLDIHTTTSDIRMTPIVTDLNDETRRIISFTDSEEVALMGEDMARRSLIGQAKAGVSLEFNEVYAKTEEAFGIVLDVVDGLLENKTATAKPRRIFHITGTIPRTNAIPEDTRNFKIIPELNVYPFLLNERAYPDLHALKATKVELREF